MPAILDSGHPDESFELSEFNLIGRSPRASIQLHDGSVSREHASIRFEDGDFWLHDLGSSNGSYVNELPVTNARRLRPGDRIQFGAKRFSFDITKGDNRMEEEEGDGQAFKTQMLKKSAVGPTITPAVLLVGDLREFTRLSTQLPADQLAILVRSWYEQTRAVLEEHEAYIDKFIGDAVFAYWKGCDPAIKERALAAARLLAIGGGSASQTRRMVLERYKVSFDCHVGLHVGEVALGTMTRSNFTAVGDAVNKTFRIEAMTRPLAARVLASEDFLEGLDHRRPEFVSRGRHPLKGYSDPVELFSLAEFDAAAAPDPAASAVTAAPELPP